MKQEQNAVMRPYRDENDFWRIRNFLREVYLLNDGIDQDSHVALLDHWRWHYILTCQETGPVDQVTTLWEVGSGRIAAVLHPICHDEVRLHVHPELRTKALDEQMIAFAEQQHAERYQVEKLILYIQLSADDIQRQQILARRGYAQRAARFLYWQRDLEALIPEVPVVPGYEIRPMGDLDEHLARSWASWRAFHADEPVENYDGDYSWYRNMQSAPLYRRDLDLVAATPGGEIGAFATISYDDATRSAVIVLEGTAAEHRRRGLERALTIAGMQRLRSLGCTRLHAISFDEASESLYRSLMDTHQETHPWVRIWVPAGG